MKKIMILILFALSILSFSSELNVISQNDILEEIVPLLKSSNIYEKYQNILARIAIPNEIIKTYTSTGYETQNIAKSGDYIVKNNTEAQEMYILTEDKFQKRYEFLEKVDNIWSLYKPIGKVKAIKLDKILFKKLSGNNDSFYIITSWNEKMIVKEGDFLVSPLEYNEIYRIDTKEFWETYKLLK